MTTKFRLIIAILFILCIFSSGLTQGNWEMMLPPSPTSNQLVSLCFIDEHTGWAVGEYGTILKTTDGGESWRVIEISWLDYLKDVNFPSYQIGYAVGQNGQIIKSTDSGESWIKLTTKYTNNLNRVRFRDENNGWIIGEKGLILHTTDGGAIWDQQVSNSLEELKGIALNKDSSLCVVGTDSTILISSDNGLNWQSADFEFYGWKFDYENIDFNDVYFLNDTLGWIGGAEISLGGKGIILTTINGGQSWKEEMYPESVIYNDICAVYKMSRLNNGIQQIYFKDLKYGICLLTPGKNTLLFDIQNVPFYTQDEGKSWESNINGCKEFSGQYGRFCFLTNSKVINTGFGGEFRFSYDGGLTWDYVNDSKRALKKIVVCNNGRLLALKKLSKGYDYLFSNDFGKNWQSFTPQVFDSTGNLIEIKLYDYFLGSFIDDSEILWTINLNTKQIFKSEDFGITWHWVRSGVSRDPRTSQFLSPDTLIHYELQIVELSPDIYTSELVFNYSFDGGKTVTSNRFPGLWNDITPPYASWPRKLDKFISNSYFFDGNTGFLVGTDGNIIKTTDTGRNWIGINSGVVEDLFDIEFINQSVGFVVGKFGRILKTEDGGDTWRKTDSGTQEDIYAVAFKNENEGWVGTESGLRYTNDGGETWHGIPMRYKHGLIQYIKFDKAGNGYAYKPSPFNMLEEIGIDKTIPHGYTFLLYWKSDKSLVEKYHDGEIFPETLTLYPNYPNPFNSCTSIVYYLSKKSCVRLKIYDIQGRLVRTLVDEKQKSGEHKVFWDGLSDYGQEVTSGVYIYRIESRGEVKTRKMMLLR